MAVRYLAAADREYYQAVRRYRLISTDLAVGLVAEVDETLERIAQFPEHGSPYIAGTRRVVLRRFPFSLVYDRSGDTIVVIALAHHSRRSGYWRRRRRG
jgi:plasmid stabilization system protein ParE